MRIRARFPGLAWRMSGTFPSATTRKGNQATAVRPSKNSPHFSPPPIPYSNGFLRRRIGGRWGMRAISRPETTLFGNFIVRLRIPLCGVLEYAFAKILIFLELAQKSLVSGLERARYHRIRGESHSLGLDR